MSRLRAVGAAILMIASLTGCGKSAESADLSQGPAVVPHPHVSAYSYPVGKEFTDGMEVFRIRGDQPAVLRSVEFVGARGLELIGFKIADENRKFGGIQFVHDWPPTSDPDLPQEVVKPGRGAVVAPGAGKSLELLLGVRVTGAGLSTREGIQIRYSVGGDDHSVYFPARLEICTTSERYLQDSRCPAP